jgi:hypothetical protein
MTHIQLEWLIKALLIFRERLVDARIIGDAIYG